MQQNQIIELQQLLTRTRESQIRAAAIRDRSDAALADLERRVDAIENGDDLELGTLLDAADQPCPDYLPVYGEGAGR